MKKIRIGTNVFLPMPVVLVGTEIAGRPNFLTVGWVSRVNTDPPMIAIGINRANATPDGIQENKTFSVNLPTAEMVTETDYCGLVSGRDTDKSGIFDLFRGVLTGAPMIQNCPLTMECRLTETIELPTNLLFIGEIVAGYVNTGMESGGKPDMKAINPLLLTMPDNSYWTLGEYAGKAWAEGKRLKNKN
ncbi:flavin reductase family protein [Methanogenium organophilum]|uniref:Flavin reductase family protein n=1 Tax=Methanogenium organophilum TaxID=2199 RepID=A0A9X9T8D0_METOG|nr:flavin reductase family protein [Methanogenium organophilum]WAI02318.1 flavin reductase family protein [Methanogenium organophilum]